MEIRRSQLYAVLEKLKGGYSATQHIPLSHAVSFVDGKVSVFDDEMSVVCFVDDPGIAAINAIVDYRILVQFLEKTKREVVEVEQSEREVLLHAGRTKVGLAIFDGAIFSPLPDLNWKETLSWSPLPDDFAAALEFCLPACQRSLEGLSTAFLHITDSFVEATDTYQAARYNFSSSLSAGVDFLLFRGKVPALVSLSPEAFYLTEGWVHFRCAGGVVASLRTRVMDFPPMSSVLVVEGEHFTFPQTTVRTLERCIIFSQNQDSATKDVVPLVSVIASDKEIHFHAEGKGGWVKEHIRMKTPVPTFHFKTSVSALQEALKCMGECIVGPRSILFREGGRVYVIATSSGDLDDDEKVD